MSESEKAEKAKETLLKEAENPEKIEDLQRAENLKDQRSTRALRETHATFWKAAVAVQLAIVNAVLIVSGFGQLYGVGKFTVSDELMKWYMTGTFVEVIGVAAIVVRGLFSQKN